MEEKNILCELAFYFNLEKSAFKICFLLSFEELCGQQYEHLTGTED